MKKLFIAIMAILAVGITYADFMRLSPKDKLVYAESAIASLYVDTVNEDKLVEDAIRGMLEKLDPHSSYSTPEETRELNEPLQGNFSGIGISFNMNKDTLYVLEVIGGGPSEKVGILPGDRIVAVNDTVIAGVKMKNNAIIKRLRGPKGTKVNLKVLRKDRLGSDTIPFTITRDNIPIESVDAYYMVDDKTGYIRLSRFAEASAKDVTNAIKELKKKGMKQLIFDLTDNGGGYLNASVDILAEFLPANSLAVYTEGLNSRRNDNKTNPSGKRPEFEDGRVVVMMNQYSASASEITAGAMQDWDRAPVVGRRSFGKGLVQRPIPFPDGSMIRLTTAHYYTPSGRSIQKPYVKGEQEKYAEDMKHRLESGELMHADSIHVADSLKTYTLRNKRVVYGGGGIYPDRFVPLDTTEYTKYYRNLTAKGVINAYSISYVDENRDKIRKQYKNDDDFVERFQVTPEMMEELRQLGEKEGVEYNAEEAAQSDNLIRWIVKGLIGRGVYTNATYNKVYNRNNPIFQEAYRLISSPEYDEILRPKTKL